MFDERDHSMNAREQYYGSPDMKLASNSRLCSRRIGADGHRSCESFVPTELEGYPLIPCSREIKVVLGWVLNAGCILKPVPEAAWVIGTEREFNPDILSPLGSAFLSIETTRPNGISQHHFCTKFTDRFGATQNGLLLSRNDSADNRADHFINTGIYIYCTPNIHSISVSASVLVIGSMKCLLERALLCSLVTSPQ